MAEHHTDGSVELDKTEARQGIRGQHVLRVLLWGVALAVVALIAVEYVFR